MSDRLFCRAGLQVLMDGQARRMREEIDAMDGNHLLNTAVEDICDYFEQKYIVEVPKLDETAITVERHEARVSFLGVLGPIDVPGTSVSFYVPFSGDADLFQYRPSMFGLNPPQASVTESHVVLTCTCMSHDADGLRRTLRQALDPILEYLATMAEDVVPFNSSLRSQAQGHIEARRQKLLKDQELMANLGFPLRHQDIGPQTYVAPSVRRKLGPSLPPAGVKPHLPEPVLDMPEYERILSVMSNMATVMERTPGAFRKMQEEDIRTHFLVQLNGLYEGQATGETFNFEGKTDVLIREKGKNIFIAECLFWDGPQSLTRKVDQLLGYATWRDTRLALLVFNRGGAFSAVVGKIPEAVKAHPCFKSELPFAAETGYRCVVHHRDDPHRRMILTVLAFEVPT